MSLNNRPCGVRKSTAYPDAYTKDELVELAVAKLGLSSSGARKLTMAALCKDLASHGSRSPVRKASGAKRAKRGGGKAKLGARPEAEGISGRIFASRSPIRAPSVKLDPSKKCSARRAAGIKRYLRSELEALLKKQGLSGADLKYEEMCEALGIPIFEVPPKSKKSTLKKKSLAKSAHPRVEVEQPSAKTRCKMPLKDHQKLVYNHIKKNRGLIVVHSVGSGKTLTAVAAAQSFLDSHPSGTVNIITPVSLQGNFKKEIIGAGFDPEDPRLKFFTYEGFVNARDAAEVQCKKSMLIIDEAHNLRNAKTLRAGALTDCAHEADKVLLLTATPLINKPYDIMSLLKMADPKVEPVGEKTFNAMFADSLKVDSAFKKTFGCKVSFFAPSACQRSQDYPRVEYKNEYFEMNPTFLKKYKALEANQQDLLPEHLQQRFEKDPTKFYTGLRIAANSLEYENSQKIKYVVDAVKKHPRKKFVLFSHFLEAGSRMLQKLLDDAGVKWVKVDGSMSKGQRDKAVALYNSDNPGEKPEIQVMMISTAGAEGLDLKRTGYVMLLDAGWNENEAAQVIGRAVRYKSHESLPEKDRVVGVVRLYMVKPHEYKILQRSGNPLDVPINEKILSSVDLYLQVMGLRKQEVIDKFLDKLKAVSIESMKC
jgi:superfamily II DNA or RNA helicase